MKEDIERIFITDVIEKKKSGRGIFNRASRKGYIKGGVKTPSDFLTRKEIKKLNGEVVISNMYSEYDKIENCNLNEILSKSENEIKGILSYIKNNHTGNKISKQFGVSIGKLYSVYEKYGVYKKESKKETIKKEYINFISKEELMKLSDYEKGKYFKGLINRGYKIREIIFYYNLTLNFVNKCNKIYNHSNDEEVLEKMVNIEDKKKEEFTGLYLTFNGVCEKEELSNRLLSIDSITVDNKKYEIKIELKELDK